MGCVSNQIGAVLVEGVKPFPGEKPILGQNCVKGGTPMPLAQNESIPFRTIGLVGVYSQYAAIEDSKNIGTRKGRAYVGATGPICHLQYMVANGAGQGFIPLDRWVHALRRIPHG